MLSCNRPSSFLASPLVAALLIGCGPSSSGGTTGGTGGVPSTSSTGGAPSTSSTGAGGAPSTSSTGAGGAPSTSSTGAGGSGGASSSTSTSSSSTSSSSSSGGVAPSPTWVKVFPQPAAVGNSATVQALATDGAGHVIVGGRLDGPMTFGSKMLVSDPYGSGYVLALDGAGAPLWALKDTGPTEGGNTVMLSVNAAGRIVALATGAENMSYGNSHVLAYGSNGTSLWSKNYGGFTTIFGVHAVLEDATGSVLTYSHLTDGQVDFGGGPITASNSYHLAKWDASGAYLWSKTVGPYRASADAAGNVFGATFDATAIDFGCPMQGHLARLDPLGNCLWTKRFTGAVPVSFFLQPRATGESLLFAPFTGLVDFGCGPMASTGTSLAVIQYTAAGACAWARSFTGAGFGVPSNATRSVTPTGAGNWAVQLGYSGAIDPGGGPIAAMSDHTLVFMLDAAGGFLWSQQISGVVALAGDAAGDLFLAGPSGGAQYLDFGGGPVFPTGNGIALAKLPP